jgi:DNA-binding NarL/FixJ family response regulator
MTLHDDLPTAMSHDYPIYPEDAPSSVVASEVHRHLRDEAILNDAMSDAQVPLALFWEALKSGVCRVVDSFFTSTRCYIVTAGVACHAEPALEGQRLEILERILSGTVQKSIALDLNLAASTVALNARLGLRSLGVSSKPSRVHPLLMLAARAARDGDTRITGTLSVVFPNGVSLRCIAVSRPDAGQEGVLPPAELAVIRELVEGRSYEEIAARRGTSQRTIANQIVAVFRRKAVSGRNDLVHRLFEESPLQRPIVPPPVMPVTAWAS